MTSIRTLTYAIQFLLGLLAGIAITIGWTLLNDNTTIAVGLMIVGAALIGLIGWIALSSFDKERV